MGQSSRGFWKACWRFARQALTLLFLATGIVAFSLYIAAWPLRDVAAPSVAPATSSPAASVEAGPAGASSAGTAALATAPPMQADVAAGGALKWSDAVTLILTATAIILAALAIILAVAAVVGYAHIKEAAEKAAREEARGIAAEVAAEVAPQFAEPIAARTAKAYMERMQDGQAPGEEFREAETREEEQPK